MRKVVSILVAVAVVATLMVSNAFAWRDSDAKARGDNTSFWGSSKGRHVTRTYRSHCVVQTAKTDSPKVATDSPKAVASSDTQQKSYRRFSYEPSNTLSKRFTSHPKMRSLRSTNRPRYLGSKAVRNNYRNP